jgi:hypothetical protein
LKTKETAGGEAVKTTKTSKHSVKQVIPKSKSMSAINKKITACVLQPLSETTPSLPKEPQETPADIETSKTVASVRPVQKVTPMVNIKTSPENNQETGVLSESLFDESTVSHRNNQETSVLSASIFDEIAATQGGASLQVGNVGGLRGPKTHNHVRFHDVSVNDERESQEEVKENSTPQVIYYYRHFR